MLEPANICLSLKPSACADASENGVVVRCCLQATAIRSGLDEGRANHDIDIRCFGVATDKRSSVHRSGATGRVSLAASEMDLTVLAASHTISFQQIACQLRILRRAFLCKHVSDTVPCEC